MEKIFRIFELKTIDDIEERFAKECKEISEIYTLQEACKIMVQIVNQYLARKARNE